MEFKKVFLTGGSGFVGHNLIKHLVSSLKVEVVAIARSEKAAKVITEAGGKAVVGVDLQDSQKIEQAATGCDVAVHCAADVTFWGDINVARQINVEGTRNVINACRKAGVKRIIHVGTENGFLTGYPLVNADETMPFPPEGANYGPYSITKKEAEIVAKSLNGNGIEVIVVRPRFIWGDDDTVVLPPIVKAVYSGDFKWFSGGEYNTSTVHIRNCCHGIVCALKNGKAGESYYLSDGNPIQFKKFCWEMLLAVGVPESQLKKIGSVPFSVVWYAAFVMEKISALTGKQPVVTRGVLATIGLEVTVNDAKARKEIGYSNVISMEEGYEGLRKRYENRSILQELNIA